MTPAPSLGSLPVPEPDASDDEEEEAEEVSPALAEDSPCFPAIEPAPPRVRAILVRPPRVPPADLGDMLNLLAEYLAPLRHLRLQRRRAELRCTPRAGLDFDALNQVVETLRSQGATVTFLYRD